ncbi:MAG: hypothetical protein H6772_03230 [Pseudomonadales bacterium]|nr:hypothetical protein [Pseudomonadales bacterium]
MGGIPLFLNWVKIPEFYDFGLSFLSLSGFDYFNYFEKIGLITNDIEIFCLMISFLLIAIIIKFLRSIKIEIQAFRKNKEIIFHYMFIFSIIILFFAYLINFLGSFHFFHIRQMFVLASIISIYWGYALAMQKNKSDLFLYIFIILLITSSNYKNIFYPKFDFPQRNHDEIVIISPHLLEVGYYKCEATSYNALIKLCPLKNILFDIKKTELLDQDEEFLLHSEVYLNHKNLNIKCIKVPGDFYKCSNLSK